MSSPPTGPSVQAVRGVQLNNAAVITLAGGSKLQAQWLGGSADGFGTSAAVSLPSGLAVTADSAVAFIADFGNQRIRALDLGSLAVSTLLGEGPCADCAINVLEPGNGVAVTADGSTLLSSNFSFGLIQLWKCPAETCPQNEYLRPCSLPTLNVSLTPCVQCPPNSVAPAGSAGPASCACALGYFRDPTGACVACPAGTFKNHTGDGSCISCPAGGLSAPAGSVSANACQVCAPGLTNVSGACEACSDGTYKAVGANLTCSACGAGTVSSADRTQCICAAGYFGPGGGPCAPCAAGTYNELPGATACTSCPANSTSAAGAGSVANCECVAGYQGVLRRGPACCDCGCSACTVGTYKAGIGPGPCVACPSGTTTLSAASAGGASCVPECGPGSFRNFSSATAGCAPCIAGTYKTSAGSDPCTACADPHSTSPANAVSAAACTCVAGYYPSAGAGACAQCPLGSYAAGGASACTLCPANMTTAAVGSWQSSACVCAAGFAGRAGGPCTACVTGKFKAAAGPGNCSNCSGRVPCNAPLLWYNCTAARDAGCRPCPNNSTTTIGGGVACLCLPGYTSANQSAVAIGCTGCAVGTYKSAAGQAPCLACPNGAYAALPAATACVACPAGMVTPAPGAVSVAACACPAGKVLRGGFVAVNFSAAGGLSGNYSQADLGVNGYPAYLSDDATRAAWRAGQCAVDGGPAWVLGPVAALGGCTNATARSTGAAPDDILAVAGWVVRATGNTVSWTAAPGAYLVAPAAPAALGCKVCANQTQSPPCPGVPAGFWSPCNVTDGQCRTCPLNSSASAGGPCACNLGHAAPSGGASGGCTPCAAGTYASATGATACTACPSGATSPPGSTHSGNCSCPAGYESTGGGSSLCSPCVFDTYKSTPGPGTCAACGSGSGACFTATSCTCNAGLFLQIPGNGTAGTGGTCLQCARPAPATCTASSYWRDCTAATDAACTPCPLNSSSPPGSSGITSCACNPGTTGPAGGPCVACPINTFKSSPGSALCTLCAPGSVAPAGATACVCAAGFGGQLNSPCISCVPGKYKMTAGDTQCIACPSGSTGPAGSNWSFSCVCRQGFTLAGGCACNASGVPSASGLYACPGPSCPGYALACGPTAAYSTCNASTFWFSGTARIPAQCLPCPPTTGSLRGANGIAACQCPAGSVATSAYAIMLTAWAGSTSSSATFWAADALRFLAYGGGGASLCSMCPADTYQPEMGSPCLPCPNSTVSAPGSTAFSACGCIPGYQLAASVAASSNESASSGLALCEPCPIGTYKQITGASLCIRCDMQGATSRNTTTTMSASANSSMCVCSPGFYLPTPPPARRGAAAATVAVPVCTKCPAGKYKAEAGEEACDQCAPGSWSTALGATVCQLCSAGKYNPIAGQRKSECFSCFPCPDNSITVKGAADLQASLAPALTAAFGI